MWGLSPGVYASCLEREFKTPVDGPMIGVESSIQYISGQAHNEREPEPQKQPILKSLDMREHQFQLGVSKELNRLMNFVKFKSRQEISARPSLGGQVAVRCDCRMVLDIFS